MAVTTKDKVNVLVKNLHIYRDNALKVVAEHEVTEFPTAIAYGEGWIDTTNTLLKVIEELFADELS